MVVEKERLLEGDTQFLLGVNQNLEHEAKRNNLRN
tara:strand:+ start:229 stop:333 length:105 start_codon:yes stop_codon:yes gene_type:complete